MNGKPPTLGGGGLMTSWQQIADQLDGLAIVCSPHGLGAPLGLAIAMHAQRRADLAMLTGHGRRNPRAGLRDAARAAHRHQRAGRSLDDPARRSGQGTGRDARNRSRGAACGRARSELVARASDRTRPPWQKAAQLRNSAVFETLEATLADAEAKIAITRLNGASGSHEQTASRSALATDMRRGPTSCGRGLLTYGRKFCSVRRAARP